MLRAGASGEDKGRDWVEKPQREEESLVHLSCTCEVSSTGLVHSMLHFDPHSSPAK